jgi:hypothetical protein
LDQSVAMAADSMEQVSVRGGESGCRSTSIVGEYEHEHEHVNEHAYDHVNVNVNVH